MVTFIPHRYTEPKWQAFVTPESKAFVFSNGYKVRSIWELKQALATLPEDEVRKYVNPETNSIADWVQDTVKDEELADALRKYDHRWGLIVALERQMMRTMNLPHYVALRWLGKAEYDFTFVSGEKVHTLEELAQSLGKVTDETVQFHMERVPNDISRWVTEVVGDYILGEILEEASNRDQMRRFVEDHLVMLKEASEV